MECQAVLVEQPNASRPEGVILDVTCNVRIENDLLRCRKVV